MTTTTRPMALLFDMTYCGGCNACVEACREGHGFSDGKDEASRFEFEQTMDYAKRAGITIYSLGLRINDAEARRKLDALAEATGGRSFHI